jgi:uncharacterized protein YjbI with pentapeptide repeats
VANAEQLERLRRGVEAWNNWRREHPDESVGLGKADLTSAALAGANLTDSNLWRANLTRATLSKARLSKAMLNEAILTDAIVADADLRGADLTGATLTQADLTGATLNKATLTRADLTGAKLTRARLAKAHLAGVLLPLANLWGANLKGADLAGADLTGADLTLANLSEAALVGANLWGANLTRANLTGANLANANLTGAKLAKANLTKANLTLSILVETQLEKANLAGCRVYGVSAWDVRLDGAKQAGLVITRQGEAEITVDDLEVAQFIYLLLNNQRIRRVLDTITSKVVLVLGRFTPERKPVLDALRDTLRAKDYSPVVFDFEKPESRNLTETIRVLAGMARFVIADITDAKSIPQELMAIVPDLPSVPVQPLLLASGEEYALFRDLRDYPWVLKPVLYRSPKQLVNNADALVIAPAERRLKKKRSKA